MSVIPNCIPWLEGNEKKYLAEAVDQNWVGPFGGFVSRFEKQISEFVGVPHAVGVSSGTAALQLALIASGIQPNDEILVPALTFVASANAVVHAGGKPHFIDVNAKSMGMDPIQLRKRLEAIAIKKGESFFNRETGNRIAGILPVDLYGHPCDYDAIAEVASEFNLFIVEDATESLGGRYKEKPVGSYAAVSCLSFNGNKMITCGSGGMVLCHDTAIAKKIRHLSNQAKMGDLEFEHDEVGYNFRLPGLNAALGCAQAEKLSEILSRKESLFKHYVRGLEGSAHVKLIQGEEYSQSSYWMPILEVTNGKLEDAARPLLKYLLEKGVQARSLWQPLSWQKPYRSYPADKIPVSEALYRRGLCLPCSAGISRDELDRAVKTILDFNFS